MNPEDPQFPDTTTGTDFPRLQNELLWGDGESITLNVLEAYLEQKHQYLGFNVPGEKDSGYRDREEELFEDYIGLLYLNVMENKPTTENNKEFVILSAQNAARHFESLLENFEENSIPYRRLSQAIALINAKRDKLIS